MPITIRDYEPQDFSNADDWANYARSEVERAHPEMRRDPTVPANIDPTTGAEINSVDIAAAAFREQNTVGSAIDWVLHSRGRTDDPNYDGLQDMPDDLANFSDDFEASGTPQQTELLIHDLRRERSDQEMLDNAGGEGIAWQFAAAIADPSMLLPWTWEAKLGQFGLMGERMMKGGRIARGAKVGGALAASETVAAGAAELLLQGTQYERAWQETLINIGGTAILSGVTGAAFGALSRGQNADISDAIMRSLNRDKATVASEQMPTADKLIEIADRGEHVHIEPDEMVNAVFGTKMSRDNRFLSWLTPLVRLQRSRSPHAINLTDELVQHRLLKKSNLEGEATPMAAETEILQLKQGAFVRGKKKHDVAYKEQKAAGYDMSRAEFNQAVGDAMRKGDASEIEAVAKAARGWREEVVGPLSARARAAGLFDEESGLFGAASYFPRVYRQDRIGKDPEFHKLLTDTFYGRGEEMAFEIAQDLASDVIRTLRHAPTGRLPNEFISEKGFSGRSLMIADARLQPWLEQDVEKVMMKYLQTYAPDTVLTERFGSFSLKKQFDLVKSDFDDLAKGVDDPDVVGKLANEYDVAVKDLEAMRDRLRGMDGPPADGTAQIFNTVLQPFRALTGMTYLGGQVVSAIPDLGFVVLQQGFGPTLKAFASRVLSQSFRKMSKEELAGIGVGVDNYLNARSFALTYQDPIVGAGKLQEAGRWGTAKFSQLSGMSLWNSVMKRIAGAAAQTKIINAGGRLLDGKSLSKALRTQLASVGLNEEMLKRIAAQSRLHGTNSKFGGWIGNTARWADDAEAARMLELVSMREVETTIVTPGVGDRPLITSNEGGKFLLQFKSFLIAAHNQASLPAMQRLLHVGDAQVAGAIGVLLALGLLQDEIKMQLRGKPSNFEEMNVGDITKAAIDGSGIMGMWPVGFDTLDQLSQANISEALSLTPTWRSKQTPRFATSVPAIGLIERQISTVANLPEVADDEGYWEATKSLWRVAPFQNLFYTQWATNPPKPKRAKKSKVR